MDRYTYTSQHGTGVCGTNTAPHTCSTTLQHMLYSNRLLYCCHARCLPEVYRRCLWIQGCRRHQFIFRGHRKLNAWTVSHTCYVKKAAGMYAESTLIFIVEQLVCWLVDCWDRGDTNPKSSLKWNKPGIIHDFLESSVTEGLINERTHNVAGTWFNSCEIPFHRHRTVDSMDRYHMINKHFC